MATIINSKKFSYVVNKLREFFLRRNFIEVHTQNRLSILVACEDVNTISTFNFAGETYPLPQTGQMWLEYELLQQPNVPGYFCVSTSYRNEPNPVPGRHDLIFPMFEFELKGDMEVLQKMEEDLLEHLGYWPYFPQDDYANIAENYGVKELTHKNEQNLCDDHGEVYFIRNFPEETSPFWNMRRNRSVAKKIDVILSGQETIGSAERSCDPEDMRQRFYTISDGEYAKTLYNKFGKERVDKELEQFLSFKFIERSGGGIGITRLIRSMEKEGLLPREII